ncbi:MAG: hypothetical protein NW207_07340 [Cytophagales bacterium]|nr:hypothetical protein [Cytophagales bacterium]
MRHYYIAWCIIIGLIIYNIRCKPTEDAVPIVPMNNNTSIVGVNTVIGASTITGSHTTCGNATITGTNSVLGTVFNIITIIGNVPGNHTILGLNTLTGETTILGIVTTADTSTSVIIKPSCTYTGDYFVNRLTTNQIDLPIRKSIVILPEHLRVEFKALLWDTRCLDPNLPKVVCEPWPPEVLVKYEISDAQCNTYETYMSKYDFYLNILILSYPLPKSQNVYSTLTFTGFNIEYQNILPKKVIDTTVYPFYDVDNITIVRIDTFFIPIVKDTNSYTLKLKLN